jgi:hypothetical protein
VVLLLGLPELAGAAHGVEQRALAADAAGCGAAWVELQCGLERWLQRAGGQPPAP